MKKAILSCLIFFTFQIQAQTLDFVHQLGGAQDDYTNDIILDDSGHIYTVGSFSDTVDFDPGPGVANLISAGGLDLFVLKLDSLGNFIWAVSMGGGGTSSANAVHVDDLGNIYLTGAFTGSMDIDPDPGSVQSLSSNGSFDVFVIKLNSQGQLLWGHSFGAGSILDQGFDIDVDAAGNVYATGVFESTVDFDPGSSTSNTTSNGFTDAFLLKLDSNGSFVWVETFGNTGIDFCYQVQADRQGGIYLGGGFGRTVDFDPGPGVVSRTSIQMDGFLLKLDTAGSYQWVQTFGGSGNEVIQRMEVVPNSAIYTGGYYTGKADLDPGPDSSIHFYNGQIDVFLQKFDINGNYQWDVAFGGYRHEYIYDIGVDPAGHVYTVGSFERSVNFGAQSRNDTLTSAGPSDGFIHKVDANGNYLWAKQIGGQSDDRVGALVLKNDFTIIGTGNFKGTADLDPDSTTLNLTTNGLYDSYIFQWNQCPPTSSTESYSVCNSFTWKDSITYTASTTSAYLYFSTVNGCDSVVYLDLTINGVDDTSISVSGATITANSDSATYQWLDCDNGYAVIAGETSKSFTPAVNGDYAVQLSQDGCVDTSACVNINNVSIVERNFGKGLTLYPNPNNGSFMVTWEEPMNEVQIEIIDVQGRVLNRGTLRGANQFTYELQQPAGVYFVKLISEKGESAVLRVIKQ